ncbi:dipeptide ABC transporter ATP-binding protein [Microvirga brassicacearum]|uniref:Dipeptide ABC transporter ATP-binding protein n=1 Tax=Microvirga brassicacearum TaxID=2580413 RepID=A0A5N3PJ87_9HYPH|nr:dipeptide ABC transporter ATP-binding protein [Microvirga brassicacearum]KAB0269788.1 dipeptide ABC transporter ATP-binding protein [Microvirga brassicacearum]
MTTPLLSARNIRRIYEVPGRLFEKSARVHALDDISFDLRAGRTLAVVGESGSGKSTLARILSLLEEPDGGEIVVAGEDTRTRSQEIRKRQRSTVQMVFQNPYGSLNPRKSVGRIMEEPLFVQGFGPAQVRAERARAMLAKVGLRPEHYWRFPHMFSGGQRQRIAIGRALMLTPKIVIADEPVSALDISIQAQILNLLMDLQEEFGLSYLFISHDLSVVRVIADEVLVLYYGRLMEFGSRDAIFSNPRHPYTRTLLAAAPTISFEPEPVVLDVKVSEPPSAFALPKGCVFHPRCPMARDICREVRPEVRNVEDRLVACHFAEQRP